MTNKFAKVLLRCAEGEEVEASRPVIESSCRVLASMLGDACVDDSELHTFDVSDFGKATVEAFLGLASMMSFEGTGAVGFTMENVLRDKKELFCASSHWHIDLAIGVVEFAIKYDATGVLGFFRLSLSSCVVSDRAYRINLTRNGEFSGKGFLMARLLVAVLKADCVGDSDDLGWVPLGHASLLVNCMLKKGTKCISIVDVPVEIREVLFRRVLQEAHIPKGEYHGFETFVSKLAW